VEEGYNQPRSETITSGNYALVGRYLAEWDSVGRIKDGDSRIDVDDAEQECFPRAKAVVASNSWVSS